MQQRWLGLGEALGHCEEVGRHRPWALEPPPERLDGHLVAFLVSQAKSIDEAALGAVDAGGQALVDFDGLATHVEGVFVKAVPPDWGVNPRRAA